MAMKTVLFVSLIFWLGFYAGRWDKEHGAKEGRNLGRYVRAHFLGLK